MAAKPGKKVSVIPARPQYDRSIRMAEKHLRVAAYCRVSTGLEEQEGSYEAQVKYYTEKIKETPSWENAGIYADDGKSATSTQRRDDFRAMIKDALDGKIDMILTKSVSRFARNTVDSLTTIRQLKEKNVAVVFEKEGVNTLDGTGEILVTILSSLAQEESRNISENTRWGVARRFENGKVFINHNRFMGYTKNAEGELVIVPEEAEVVKLVFRLYLEGNSSVKIARYLEQHGIKTATGGERWYSTTIDKMLRNEKYMGDALLQKTYTVDFMTKKRLPNHGEMPQYYVEDDHEPIIPKELFYKVQEELMRRASLCKAAQTRKKNKKRKYSSLYALTGLVICGACGHEYRRVTWARNGMKKVVWRCTNRLNNGVESCGTSPTIPEDMLHRAVMAAVQKIASNQGDFVDAFRQNVVRVIGSNGQAKETDGYEEQIGQKQQEMVELIAENAKAGVYTEAFDRRYQAIAEEIRVLKERQMETRRRKKLLENEEQRIRDLDDFLRSRVPEPMEYDDGLVRKLISRIEVLSAERIRIWFQSGICLEEGLGGE